MAFDSKGLESYNDVASRMTEFFAKHPEGSLQPANAAQPFEVKTIGDKAFIVYTAAAYRTPDDTRPGIGIAWEPFPGKTPYTRDSEIQNAETSAWGRAILAVGAADTRKGVASQEEVRNRQADRDSDWDQAQPARPPQQTGAQLVEGGLRAIQAAATVEAVHDLRQRVDGFANDTRFNADDIAVLYAAANARETELTGNVIGAGNPPGGKPMTDQRKNKMFALFSEVGLDDRAKQVEFIQKVTRREIASRNDVTNDEAYNIIGALESQVRMGGGRKDRHLTAVNGAAAS